MMGVGRWVNRRPRRDEKSGLRSRVHLRTEVVISGNKGERVLGRVRLASSKLWLQLFALLASLGGAAAMASLLHEKFPVDEWLFWTYAKLWFWQGVFSLACMSAGNTLLRRTVRTRADSTEHWLLSMALGVVVFVLAMYASGALGWYSPLLGLLLPAALTLAGLPDLVESLWTVWRARQRPRPALGIAARIAIGAGVIGAAFLYLQIATPDGIAYDATWSHLVIAEDYAREGGIVPFLAETPKNLPHLHSFVYTWGYLVPGFSELSLRWMMGQHLEFTLFLWTLVGVSAAVSWLTTRRNAHAAWSGMFLFPGFFVHDGNLGAGSDHVAAFFAPPLFLATARAFGALDVRWCALVGIFAGAALHTKFQCMYLVLPALAALGGRCVWLAVGGLRRKAYRTTNWAALWQGPLWIGVGTLVSFGPHLLKNWIYYRNPFYPLLLRAIRSSRPVFPDHPWDPMVHALSSPDFATQFETALETMVDFAWKPQFRAFGDQPVFGPLFTMMLPLLVLQALRRRRLLLGVFLAQCAVFAWGFVYKMDRNLQLVLPWLAALTAAGISVAWHGGLASRFAIVPLVGLQFAWGLKYAIAGGADRVRSTLSLVSNELHDPGKTSIKSYRRNYVDFGELLPPNALLLRHTAHIQLGINRNMLSDWAGWQYVIDYRKMRTARDVYLRYKELGITHMVWNNYDFPCLKQEDVLFFAFTRRHANALAAPPGFVLWAMPEAPPPEEPAYEVVALGLFGYANGLYDIEQLHVFEEPRPDAKQYPRPRVALNDPEQVASALRRADAVLLLRGMSLSESAEAELARCFRREHDYYAGYGIAGYSMNLRDVNNPACRQPER